MSLPQGSVDRLIKMKLAEMGVECRVTKDVKKQLRQNCDDFVCHLASNAQQLAESEKKKTIATSHIYSTLRNMGFGHYEEELKKLGKMLGEEEKKKRARRKAKKNTNSDLSKEELIAEQKRMFEQARKKHSSQLKKVVPPANRIPSNVPRPIMTARAPTNRQNAPVLGGFNYLIVPDLNEASTSFVFAKKHEE